MRTKWNYRHAVNKVVKPRKRQEKNRVLPKLLKAVRKSHPEFKHLRQQGDEGADQTPA